jgi:hypothetical protein
VTTILCFFSAFAFEFINQSFDQVGDASLAEHVLGCFFFSHHGHRLSLMDGCLNTLYYPFEEAETLATLLDIYE